MDIRTLILISIIFICLGCFLTYLCFKTSKSTMIRCLPMIISLIGVFYFGIGPEFFNYVPGITIGLVYLLLGFFFGVSFIGSLITFICMTLYKINNTK